MILAKNIVLRQINREFFHYGLFYTKYTFNCQNKNTQESQNKIHSILVNYFSLSSGFLKAKLDDEKPSRVFIKNSKTEVLKKVNTTQKIFLQNINGSESVVYLNEAEKLARHKGYSLVLIQGSSSPNQMAKYQLKKNSDVLNDNTKDGTSKSKLKVKNFVLKSDISSNDLQNKINLMIKNLDKNSVVIIDILKKNDNTSKVNEIFRSIEKKLQERHKIEYSITKGAGMKVKIVPYIDKNNINEESNKIEDSQKTMET